jgi:periplasmic protein TonB
MNHLKIKTAALALFTLCFAACNNDSSDSSPEVSSTDTTAKSAMNTDSATSSMSDTAMHKMSDTTMNKKSTAVTSSPKKKKLKASIGEMPDAGSSKYTKDHWNVYDYSEVMPSFKGGSSAIENYINDHLVFPEAAVNDSKEGKVNVKFTVDENGKVMNAHAVGAKLGDGLDEEAVNVVSSMPKWTPGTIKGKPVKVSMTLPIVFKAGEE